jgi:hypothetical protein
MSVYMLGREIESKGRDESGGGGETAGEGRTREGGGPAGRQAVLGFDTLNSHACRGTLA